MSDARAAIIIWIWQLGALATFLYLTFFDGYDYSWWNWPLALAANAFLAEIWPIYFLILRPLLGS